MATSARHAHDVALVRSSGRRRGAKASSTGLAGRWRRRAPSARQLRHGFARYISSGASTLHGNGYRQGAIFQRHARACRGHPRGAAAQDFQHWRNVPAWMAGTSPAMTREPPPHAAVNFSLKMRSCGTPAERASLFGRGDQRRRAAGVNVRPSRSRSTAPARALLPACRRTRAIPVPASTRRASRRVAATPP